MASSFSRQSSFLEVRILRETLKRLSRRLLSLNLHDWTMEASQQQKTYRKIEVAKLSPKFREATRIVSVPLPRPKENEVLFKIVWAGINASDINFTSGKYLPGVQPPFDAGFESIGTVVAVGDRVTRLKVGDAVLSGVFGAFAEYQLLDATKVSRIPAVDPSFLPLMGSGLTASLALQYSGHMTSGETVLVTAAAGGTGQFAVQLAKLAGNHVIGTCSSRDKVEFLKRLGCDRVINYKEEDVYSVLQKEYPKGVDIVYESVGGEMFDVCVNSLAVGGRLIVIGMITGYQDGSAWDKQRDTSKTPLAAKLLRKSASVTGFFLLHYMKHAKEHAARLAALHAEEKLISYVDPTPFRGLEDVAAAVDYMYSGRNIGKVCVKIDEGAAKTRL